MVKHTPALNEEQITAFLKEAVETVKTEEDPDVLNAYRKIFRKNVDKWLVKDGGGVKFYRTTKSYAIWYDVSEVKFE